MRKLILGLAAATALAAAGGAANAAITVAIYHTDANASAAAADATIAQAAGMTADQSGVLVGALNFTDAPNDSDHTTIGTFLGNPAGLNGTVAGETLDNTYFLFTGQAFLTLGANSFTVEHDDGLQLAFQGISGFAVDEPGPHSPTSTPFTVTTTSAGMYNFTLAYGETHGGPAVLQLELNGAPLSGTPEPATWGLMLVGFGGLGAMMRRRRAYPVTA